MSLYAIEKLRAYIKDNDIAAIRSLMQEHNLEIVQGVIRAKNIKKAEVLAEHNDKLQLAGKIRLNSLYGCLLNNSCRFYDERLGKSVTLTGRCIVKHMNAEINRQITGTYDHAGSAIYYSDTDSSYFSAYTEWKENPDYTDMFSNRENTIMLYDGIADIANATFPDFMHRTFNTSLERGGIIVAGRELVASKALFIKKKKYACLMYDKDGTRLDVKGKPGKLKAMGLDLKRADTPKFMQVFLESLMMDILTGADQQKMFDDIKAFRKDFIARPGWEKGTPKKVNALSDYFEREQKFFSGKLTEKIKVTDKRITPPGHVRAAMNWNQLRNLNGDRYSMEISDGSKTIVCKLRSNIHGMTSVAYPIDESRLPDWYKALPFDEDLMEQTIIDNKLTNLVGVLDWNLAETMERPADEFFVF